MIIEQDAGQMVAQSLREQFPAEYLSRAIHDNNLEACFLTEAALTKYVTTHHAALKSFCNDNHECISKLLAQKPWIVKSFKGLLDVNAQFGSNQDTLLHIAFAQNNIATAAFLLMELRANLTTKNSAGVYPFQNGSSIRSLLTMTIAKSLREHALRQIIEVDDNELLVELMKEEKFGLHEIDQFKTWAKNYNAIKCCAHLASIPSSPPLKINCW